MTTEFWMELMSLRAGLFGLQPAHWVISSVAHSGVSVDRSSATYLSGDWTKEHERNKTGRGCYLGNMGFSARTSRVLQNNVDRTFGGIKSPNKSLHFSQATGITVQGPNPLLETFRDRCVLDVRILGREYSAFILYKGVPQRGLGQCPIIEHINISEPKCMTIHTK